MKLILAAGGQGVKLWPFSTEECPKQFQRILHDKTLFSYNVETLLKGFRPKDIYISTKKRYLKYALEQAPQIPIENYIIEPNVAKNSGPAWGFVTLKMSINFPDEPYMLIQVDDIRTPEENFIKTIVGAEKLVRRDQKFITGGNKALYPILGVDYLKLNEKVTVDSDLETFKAEFVPRSNDYYKTKDLIENFHVVIHCNHLCYTPRLMLEAYKKYKLEWYEALMQMKEILGTDYEDQKIEEIYTKMTAGPVEDVSKNLFNSGYVILLPFKWVDIGTWDSLYQFYAKDNSVYADGNVIALDSNTSLVKSDNNKKLIAISNLENMVVIDTKDVLLIVPKDKIEKIKDIRKVIEEKGLKEYL